MSVNKNYMMNNPSEVLNNKITYSSDYIELKMNKSIYSTTSNVFYNKEEPTNLKLGEIYSPGTLNNVRNFQSNYLLPSVGCYLTNNTIDGITASVTSGYSNYNVINLENPKPLILKTTSFPPLNIIR
jgi:hypothetical protein